MDNIVYTAPPTLGRLMNSDAFFRIAMGPVGSGKTTALVFELLKRAVQQQPGPDGIRRTRFAIVRQTLLQLKMTILLDVLSWLRPIAQYKVSDSLITIKFADVHSEWFLIPLEDPEDQRRLLSMQLTGAWLSEIIEISPDLVPAVAGRCGRFPSTADGGPSWFGMVGDTNAPTEGSDWWKLFEDDKPADWLLFKQPSGLSALAENLEHLPGGRGYYERLARTPNKDWVRRYVEAEYGEDPAGVAVHRDSFKRQFHTVAEVEPVVGFPLLVGQDFGRNPCSLVCQPDHRGRLLVLEEVLGTDIGLEAHVTKSLKPTLFKERYLGRQVAAVGDPSGVAKGPFLEENAFDVLKRLGIPAFPAASNNIEVRLMAVDALFGAQRDAGPAIIIDRERCPLLVRALNGGYRFGKNKDGQTKPVPEKSHPASDLCDALQYVCLAFNSGMTHYIARKIKPKTTKNVKERVSPLGWT